MHNEIMNFCRGIRMLSPKNFRGSRVLEVGSYVANGSVRELFEACDYLGVDVTEGPGVDRVCPAHMLHEPDGSFDTVISTQALEHDMHYEKTVKEMLRMLKPGGLLVVTCATGTSWEHGTPGHGENDSLTSKLPGEWSKHYHNVSENEFFRALGKIPALIFSQWNLKIELNSAGSQDLLFYGIKLSEKES
jgi:SAM-dependent methyltransferase